MSFVRLPSCLSPVWLMREPLGGWYVVAGSFGWLHGSYNEALCEARRLAATLNFSVREVTR